jgi:hypothetical protein
MMLSGAAAMPPVPISIKRGSDDAYEAIISELGRVEEAAHSAGASSVSGGAVTATGQKLEAFVGHLDMQVTPFETASQVFRELRGFVKEHAKDAAKKLESALVEQDEDASPVEAGPECSAAEDPAVAEVQNNFSSTSSGPVS